MATQSSTIEFLLDQMADAGAMSAKKMFGEYGIYCGEKIVAFVCDDQLFIKPTEAGRKFIGDVTEGQPYPGAKNYFLITGDYWDDNEWLCKLIQVSVAELPGPTKKSPRRREQRK